MGMMVSAGDLISLYVSIELQSLALYILAAFQNNVAVGRCRRTASRPRPA